MPRSASRAGGSNKVPAARDKLVREKLSKGYTPARPTAAAGGRWDFSLYNEALGFVITSRDRGGRVFSEAEPEEWARGIEEGVFLPIGLSEDVGFTIRLVVGQALAPA